MEKDMSGKSDDVNVHNVAGHEIPVARNCRGAVFASIIKNPL